MEALTRFLDPDSPMSTRSSRLWSLSLVMQQVSQNSLVGTAFLDTYGPEGLTRLLRNETDLVSEGMPHLAACSLPLPMVAAMVSTPPITSLLTLLATRAQVTRLVDTGMIEAVKDALRKGHRALATRTTDDPMVTGTLTEFLSTGYAFLRNAARWKSIARAVASSGFAEFLLALGIDTVPDAISLLNHLQTSLGFTTLEAIRDRVVEPLGAVLSAELTGSGESLVETLSSSRYLPMLRILVFSEDHRWFLAADPSMASLRVSLVLAVRAVYDVMSQLDKGKAEEGQVENENEDQEWGLAPHVLVRLMEVVGMVFNASVGMGSVTPDALARGKHEARTAFASQLRVLMDVEPLLVENAVVLVEMTLDRLGVDGSSVQAGSALETGCETNSQAAANVMTWLLCVARQNPAVMALGRRYWAARSKAKSHPHVAVVIDTLINPGAGVFGALEGENGSMYSSGQGKRAAKRGVWFAPHTNGVGTELVRVLGDGVTLISVSPVSMESVTANVFVSSGRYYYEATVLTEGVIQIGWAAKRVHFDAEGGSGTGDDVAEMSFAFDGSRAMRYMATQTSPYGVWVEVGDVVGVIFDLDERFVGFSVNGEYQGEAFDHLSLLGEAYAPSVSVDEMCAVRINMGSRGFAHPPPFPSLPFASVLESTTESGFTDLVPRVADLRPPLGPDDLPSSVSAFFGIRLNGHLRSNEIKGGLGWRLQSGVRIMWTWDDVLVVEQADGTVLARLHRFAYRRSTPVVAGSGDVVGLGLVEGGRVVAYVGGVGVASWEGDGVVEGEGALPFVLIPRHVSYDVVIDP